MTDPISPVDLDLSTLTALPLYQQIYIDDDALPTVVASIIDLTGTVDQFCPSCKDRTTFSVDTFNGSASWSLRFGRASGKSLGDLVKEDKDWPSYQFNKNMTCARNRDHKLILFFIRNSSGIQKVGQTPSLADMAISQTKRYRKVLSEENLRELNQAIGLNAHGVGVGAFVYLRRIFEKLVEDAHSFAKAEPEWNEMAYQKLRTADRVRALARYLPEFMVQNHKLYGILSAHLHELSDDTCKANFEIIKEGIFNIAEEKLAELQKEARLQANKKAIAELNSKLPSLMGKP